MPATPRRSPRGFTLLELMIALTLTAVALAIASSAIGAAWNARDVVASHRERLEQETRVREALADMLRHAPHAEFASEALLRIVNAQNGPVQLTFLSQGVRAPYGSGPIWRVVLTSGPDGMSLDAEPVGATRDGTQLHSRVPSLSLLRIQALESATHTESARWRDDWPLERARPAMIAIRFDDESAHPPLIVKLDPLADVRTVLMGARP